LPLVYLNGSTTEIIIFWIGFFASFLATVSADEQNERLKNTAYGGITSTAVSVFITMLNNKDGSLSKDLILISLYGSLIGSFIAWVFFAIIAGYYVIVYNKTSSFIGLITNGLGGLKNEIIRKENQLDFEDLENWWSNLYRQFDELYSNISRLNMLDHDKQKLIKNILRYILSSICQAHNMIFRTSFMRASIIKFNLTAKKGEHWVFYSDNSSPPFVTSDLFYDNSKAYQLLASNKISETTDMSQARQTGTVQVREDSDNRYGFFTVFKIDGNHILTIDWPKTITKNNVDKIESLLKNKGILNIIKRLIKEYDDLPPDMSEL